MPGKTRPYEQFAAFILFKKLESDALSDLWRAARVDDRHLGPLVALRRLTGGNREDLTKAATEARAIVPLLTGTSFVKEQVIDVANGIPFVAYEYAGGRSLRHIIDRARGGPGVTPNPIPIDQAILIAEKIALSLATTADLRYGGTRLAHGALIPQFIWVSEDGEARVAGQQLGKGLIASLKDSKVAANIGRYFSPEYQHSGEPTQASEVYSMGAILFLLITGHEPPDAAHVSAFAQTVRAGKMMDGQPIPDDIRAILEKSLVIDPSRRFGSITDMKKALSALAHGGKYSATSFNLAFYLSNLLKKEMEGEAVDREKESKVNIAPYLEQVEIAPPPLAMPAKVARGKAGLYAAAAILAMAVAGIAFWLTKASTETAKAQIASTNTKPATPPVKPAIGPQRIAAETATTETVDPAAQKKAFEQAVSQKLQEEMAKLQTQFNKGEQKKSAPTPVALTASVAPPRSPQVMDDRPPSAAALDERRLATRQETTMQQPIQMPAPVTQTQPVQIQQPQPQPQPAAAVPAPAPTVREGDVVDYDQVDVRPQLTSKPMLRYPPMATRQRAQASLILTVLVSETGDVLDVKILRGDSRFGFNDEAIRALRATKFRPAMKDGKPVKTWIPQPVDFRLQQ